MKVVGVFRSALIIVVLGQLAWVFAPWEQLYGDNIIAVSLVSHAEPFVPRRAVEFFTYVSFLGYLAACVGMFSYRAWARSLFLVMLAINAAWSVVAGLHVQSGYEAMFGYVLTVMDGLIVGLSFYSDVANRFSRS